MSSKPDELTPKNVYLVCRDARGCVNTLNGFSPIGLKRYALAIGVKPLYIVKARLAMGSLADRMAARRRKAVTAVDVYHMNYEN